MNESKNGANEKLDGNEVSLSSKSKLVGWLDNFWFHYKWPVIIGVFFLIILIIGIVQIVQRDEHDVCVTFAGPANIDPNESLEIQSELAKLVPNDYTGDNKKLAKFTSYSVFTEEDFKGELESTQNTQQNTTNKKNFDDYVNSGECSIFFVSPYFYENFKTHDRLQSMEFILGKDKASSLSEDGYGIKLSDLGISDIEAFDVLPEDTYVCILKPYIYGESSKEDRYSNSIEYFKAIVNFG